MMMKTGSAYVLVEITRPNPEEHPELEEACPIATSDDMDAIMAYSEKVNIDKHGTPGWENWDGLTWPRYAIRKVDKIS